ncbi:hypothetical protein QAD60_05375 [Helicobacter pylori]|nr:hypothetical protein [Helicobacter pylori]
MVLKLVFIKILGIGCRTDEIDNMRLIEFCKMIDQVVKHNPNGTYVNRFRCVYSQVRFNE